MTVVALMAQGITDSSLKYPLQNAKSNGVSQKEIAAVITHAAILPFTSRGAVWRCFIKTEAFSPIFLYLGKIEAGAEYISELSGKIKTELLP